jgi:hypothetical protein
MGFLAPWFLIGAAAVALPLYLHLLRRHKTTPHPFSSLMFFERRTQSSIRHRRLRYLLLLSLRMLLLVLIALAFANPYLRRNSAAASSDRILLLVIDNSFSMRAGTRLADAKQKALAVLGARKPSDRVQVAELGSQLHVLTQPISDTAELRAAISGIQAGDSRGSFSELGRNANSLSEGSHAPVELHLFSDMQKDNMPSSFAEMAMPAGVSLVLHPVATSVEPNWTVESVDAPSQVWDPKKAHVQAVVAGYHTPAATRTVSLIVNGKTIATQRVDVPADGRATANFQTLDVPYGFSRGEIRIDSADVLPADDAYLFAVERSDPQHVLFVHEPADTHSALYFGSALASSAESSFTLDPIAVDRTSGIQLAKYSFVVLSDVLSLPTDFESDLQRYVQGGGSVLIAAGTSAGRRGRIPIFGETITGAHKYSQDGARFLAVGDADSSHPSMAGADRWAGVKFYYSVVVDPSDARVVARLTDQTPLLLDKKVGEGRVLLITSGLDNLTNDLPVHPVFVPFVKQTARYLSGTEDRQGSRQVDSYLELRTAKEQAVSVEIVDPAGRRPLSLQEATSAQSYQMTNAGFYGLRLANGRQDLIGVNSDRRESNLELIPDDVLSLWQGSGGAQAGASADPGQRQAANGRHSIWWYAMLLVLAAALAESFLAGRYLSTEREES